MSYPLKGDSMITVILAGVLGGVALTSSIWVYVERQKEPEEIDLQGLIESTIAIHEPASNLTEPDLLETPCSLEYIERAGNDLLCREMFCRMMTRGIDAKASGAECEQISNIQNKLLILETCEKTESPESCISLFDRRL